MRWLPRWWGLTSPRESLFQCAGCPAPLRNGEGRKFWTRFQSGALSYATPLLSTLFPIAFGKAQPGVILFAACALIVAGGLLGSRDLFRK